jgi:hypothetical protein
MPNSNAIRLPGQATGSQLGHAELPIVEYGYMYLCRYSTYGES